MTRIALGLTLVLLVTGCHHHQISPAGVTVDNAVEGLIDWAGPAPVGEGDNLQTVRVYLAEVQQLLVQLKALCRHLEAIRDSGDFPEFGSFQCDFVTGAGDNPPSGKPPEWP